MFSIIALSFVATVAYSQQHSCTYKGGPNDEFVLNLTAISDWTMEFDSETSGSDYYYTPCRNGLHCHQGNADYHANTAQYEQRTNDCHHYLSVDHYNSPEYSFSAAAWIFHYDEGEMCEQIDSPRRTTVSYLCRDTEHGPPAHLVNVEEREMCRYNYEIDSRLACVNESDFNANCQWKVRGPDDVNYMLDLSMLKGETLRVKNPNHYDTYFTPCQNSLSCYQQTRGPVMAMIENHETGTCDHYLARWEEGRVQPSYYVDDEGTNSYFQFHYFTGEPCHEKQDLDNVFIVNYLCDPDVDSYKVLNETNDFPCFWEMNVATSLACSPTDDIVIQAKPM